MANATAKKISLNEDGQVVGSSEMTINPTSSGYQAGRPFVAATDLSSLAAALQSGGYSPRTEEQLRQEAEALYRNQYDQAKLTAQQSYDQTAQALQSQLNQLDTSYQRQTEAQELANKTALSNADRRAMQRGMQRSSYTGQTLANLQEKGNQALNNIQQNRSDQESSIAAQQTLAQQQLAQNLAAADTAYQNNIIAKILEMQDQDYQRQQTAEQQWNQIQLQLYQLQQQDKQLNKSSGGGYSSGYSSSSSTKTPTTAATSTATQTPATGTQSLLSAMYNRDYTNPASGTTGTGTTGTGTTATGTTGTGTTGTRGPVNQRIGSTDSAPLSGFINPLSTAQTSTQAWRRNLNTTLNRMGNQLR